jgi:hypothetical protein
VILFSVKLLVFVGFLEIYARFATFSHKNQALLPQISIFSVLALQNWGMYLVATAYSIAQGFY